MAGHNLDGHVTPAALLAFGRIDSLTVLWQFGLV